MNPACAQAIGHALDQLVAVGIRLTFGWTFSPPYRGLPAEAVAFSKRNNSFGSILFFEESDRLMSHVRVDPTRERGMPPSIPSDVELRPAASGGGGGDDLFFAFLYLDDVALIHMQQNVEDESALHSSASFALDCPRLFGYRVAGEPDLVAASDTTWDVALTCLGWDINTHRRVRLHNRSK